MRRQGWHTLTCHSRLAIADHQNTGDATAGTQNSVERFELSPSRWYPILTFERQTQRTFVGSSEASALRPICPTAGQTTPERPGHLRAEKSRTAKSFVHLDAFAGNMPAEGSVVSAVIDFGVTAEGGDARLDPLTALVYLSAPEITRQPLPGTSRR